MTPFVRCALVVTYTALVVAVFSAAQEESASFRGETTVNVIEVPVQVIDKKTGEPVVGLTAADFEIYENDVRQEITNFAELDEDIRAMSEKFTAEDEQLLAQQRDLIRPVYGDMDFWMGLKIDQGNAQLMRQFFGTIRSGNARDVR